MQGRLRRFRRARWALAATSLAWVLTGAQMAQATSVTMEGTISLPTRINLRLDATSCTNTGSTVELTGDVDLGSSYFRARLSNNQRNTKTSSMDQLAEFAVEPMNGGAPVSVPKQPVNGGVGGNPWISFRIEVDGSPVYTFENIGRCVQGARYDIANELVNVPQAAQAVLGAMACDNTGSTLGIGLGNATAGITGKILFDNNKNKRVHTNDQWNGAMTVTILDPRSFTKGVHGASMSGAGGNPYVYGRFVVPGLGWEDEDNDGYGDYGTTFAGQTAWQASSAAGGSRSVEFPSSPSLRCRDLL